MTAVVPETPLTAPETARPWDAAAEAHLDALVASAPPLGAHQRAVLRVLLSYSKPAGKGGRA